ncbi:MAG: hypothetical protein KJ879_01370 [Nanoarchaeota archaeon]|nr:hypothetical protein [Nanoarchaeota archaeon]
MKLLGLIMIKFFLISALFIISNGNLHVRDSNERAIFVDAYSGWVKNIFNQSTEIVGYVIDSQWLPDEDLGWTDPEGAPN